MENKRPLHKKCCSNPSVKKRVFEVIQIGNTSDRASRTFDIILVSVIITNILILILRTFDSLQKYDHIFYAIELVTVLFFIVEYLLRIWTAEYLFPDTTKGRAVLKFMLSYDGVVDLLTILPFFFLSGAVVFRMLRVVRIFHLFRINSSYDSFNVIRNVLYEKRNQLASSIFIILVLMLAASITMYSVEHDAQPEAFENALSGIWWAVSAVFTIGYGDIYPVTLIGRIMAVAIEFLGVGAVAIPTGIISAGFVEQYTRVAAEHGGSADLPGLQRIIVSIDSAWIGKTTLQLMTDHGVSIVYAIRKGRRFVPGPEYNTELGDILVICHLPEGIEV